MWSVAALPTEVDRSKCLFEAMVKHETLTETPSGQRSGAVRGVLVWWFPVLSGDVPRAQDANCMQRLGHCSVQRVFVREELSLLRPAG